MVKNRQLLQTGYIKKLYVYMDINEGKHNCHCKEHLLKVFSHNKIKMLTL